MKSYKELEEIYNNYFALSYLSTNINNKFALISLICYLTYKVREKHPKWKCLDTLHKLDKDYKILTEQTMIGLAIVCEDFMYYCNEFPTFGISDKQIPAKIVELLKDYLPF